MTAITGIVYGALSVDGKWYIGCTQNKLDVERHKQYMNAYLRPNASKWHKALTGTPEDSWIWGVHETLTGVTVAELGEQAAAYQEAFDSINLGYNDRFPDCQTIKNKLYQRSRRQKLYSDPERHADYKRKRNAAEKSKRETTQS